MRQTIVLDFDGVIHSYASGWKGPGNIPDLPTLGAKEAIERLRETYEVVVVSSRCHQRGTRKVILHEILLEMDTGIFSV